MTTTLPKPVMRGLLRTGIKKDFIGMAVFSFLGAFAFKVFYVDPRKQAYADFYKTYDAEKQLKIMNDAGLMQSCPK